jgi:hypothetical protein
MKLNANSMRSLHFAEHFGGPPGSEQFPDTTVDLRDLALACILVKH